jgi:hypothetical protein
VVVLNDPRVPFSGPIDETGAAPRAHDGAEGDTGGRGSQRRRATRWPRGRRRRSPRRRAAPAQGGGLRAARSRGETESPAPRRQSSWRLGGEAASPSDSGHRPRQEPRSLTRRPRSRCGFGSSSSRARLEGARARTGRRHQTGHGVQSPTPLGRSAATRLAGIARRRFARNEVEAVAEPRRTGDGLLGRPRPGRDTSQSAWTGREVSLGDDLVVCGNHRGACDGEVGSRRWVFRLSCFRESSSRTSHSAEVGGQHGRVVQRTPRARRRRPVPRSRRRYGVDGMDPGRGWSPCGGSFRASHI